MEVVEIYNNIYETVVIGSNTIFLGVTEKDYFLSYESLTVESAQDLVENYFNFKGRDGAPKVIDVDLDNITHGIKITINVEYDKDTNREPASIPPFLNAWRQN